MFILFRNRMLSIRSSSRDFAYVARDRSTRKHMCHVFRCDIPARTIANTLRDICKKIMIERSQHQNLAKPVDINGERALPRDRPICPRSIVVLTRFQRNRSRHRWKNRRRCCEHNISDPCRFLKRLEWRFSMTR